MLDLVGNPEDRFSPNEAQMIMITSFFFPSGPVLRTEGIVSTASISRSGKTFSIQIDNEIFFFGHSLSTLI